MPCPASWARSGKYRDMAPHRHSDSEHTHQGTCFHSAWNANAWHHLRFFLFLLNDSVCWCACSNIIRNADKYLAKKHFTHTATPGRKHAPCQHLHKLRAASPFLLLQVISYHVSGCWAELRRSGAIWLTPVLQKAENTPVNLKETEAFRVQTWPWDDDKTADRLHKCSFKHRAPAYRLRLDVGGWRLGSQTRTSTLIQSAALRSSLSHGV